LCLSAPVVEAAQFLEGRRQAEVCAPYLSPQTPEVGSGRERKKPCEKIDDKLKQNFGGACLTVLSAILKTPQDKDMFISGSLEAGLFTQTQVKSKGNNKDTSTATVSIQVRALLDGEVVPPGVVTYAACTQTLSATLEGAIAGCLTIVTNADGSLSIVLDESCVTPEEIDLILATLNAASFDFVAVDVPQGVHTLSLQARITTSGSAQNGSFTALGFVGKGTLTVEEVRLVKGATTAT